jgi:hypothetical protein
LRDDAGRQLITSYAVELPDREWSLMLINKDPSNPRAVKIEFGSQPAHFADRVTMTTFGAEQYLWHPAGPKSHADPDGPPVISSLEVAPGGTIILPRASVTVIRGTVSDK